MSLQGTCKTALRTALKTAWSLRPPSFRNRIIYYHSVHPTLSISTRPEVFEAQILAAKALDYRFITHREIPEALRQGGTSPWIALGFDDGYEDNHDVAAPILERHGVPATFFAVAGQIRAENQCPDAGYQLYPDRRMMSRAQLRNLAAAGHEIASHGLQHELATAVLTAGRDLAAEYATSREQLSEWAGQEVVSYSYPNGQHGAYSERTRAATIAAGFRTAAVTVWGSVGPEADLFTLPRCEVAAEDTPETLVRKLTGKDDYLYVAHRIRRSPTWQPSESPVAAS
ncbi:polysaccharide deacetylase family protein [Krasilnikovia sp. MM14-A1259]|uniref:polysaccharide deacetylase family protein n=1 Tax=Krasilnikovia sp. MM14-A1259 TaxID=3373539 RepID=UPI0037FF8EEE